MVDGRSLLGLLLSRKRKKTFRIRKMTDHSLPYLVNCSLMFTEEPLLRRPAAARAAGFSAVEIWWPFPTPVPPDPGGGAVVAAGQAAGVALGGPRLFAGQPGG